MKDNMKIIIEAVDLKCASPATVSRCGVVYFDPDKMGYQFLVQTWMEAAFARRLRETESREVSGMTAWLLPPLLNNSGQAKVSRAIPASVSARAHTRWYRCIFQSKPGLSIS
eukprot:GHVU01133142.1.p1 GENE.GHVU01133142.1~~GHVU01133142.1.p1  ORF type:complete len:112 (+),score=10.76 GHVU01133142.1:522-857(+)